MRLWSLTVLLILCAASTHALTLPEVTLSPPDPTTTESMTCISGTVIDSTYRFIWYSKDDPTGSWSVRTSVDRALPTAVLDPASRNSDRFWRCQVSYITPNGTIVGGQDTAVIADTPGKSSVNSSWYVPFGAYEYNLTTFKQDPLTRSQYPDMTVEGRANVSFYIGYRFFCRFAECGDTQVTLLDYTTPVPTAGVSANGINTTTPNPLDRSGSSTDPTGTPSPASCLGSMANGSCTLGFNATVHSTDVSTVNMSARICSTEHSDDMACVLSNNVLFEADGRPRVLYTQQCAVQTRNRWFANQFQANGWPHSYDLRDYRDHFTTFAKDVALRSQDDTQTTIPDDQIPPDGLLYRNLLDSQEGEALRSITTDSIDRATYDGVADIDTRTDTLLNEPGLMLVGDSTNRSVRYHACTPDATQALYCEEIMPECADQGCCVYEGSCYVDGTVDDIDNDNIDETCVASSPGVWVENTNTTATVNVHVQDSADSPISGATVDMASDESSANYTNITATDGVAGFNNIYPESYTIVASAAGYTNTAGSASPQDNEIVNVTLSMSVGDACQPDCTRASGNRCDESCHTINGCQFNSTYVASVLDTIPSGTWHTFANETGTYEVQACEGDPARIGGGVSASVACDGGFISVVDQVVEYNGEPVRLKVVTCRRDQ